ncbi:AraC family transcriptional regulator [Actinokineospora pegani]|uniref:AraC family transcriptional regulator n=1 Tax=Actinokineospora pegani TaxID=2654637 RepID=UPI0012E9AE5B|nr:AraC family transcriptional regulator [Actinokineospora pegani]
MGPGKPRWDYRRSNLAVRGMVLLGARRDIPVSRLLATSGLDAADLADDGGTVEAAQELAVARALVTELGNPPGLGGEMAALSNLGSFGLLGFAILSSPTVRDAARVALRYLELGHAFVTLTATETPTSARLAIDDDLPDDLPDDVRDFLVERDLAVILGVVIPGFLGSAAQARQGEIHLALPFTADRGAAFAALLPTRNVTYGRPRTLITIPADILDHPAALPNPDTARVCEQQCLELLRRRRHRDGLAARVRGRLLRDPSDIPTAATIAAELHIDRRTLHRRLSAEATTFRALREEVRHTLAVEMLTTLRLAIPEVAHRLGYASPSAFTHAFTRWTGTPPSRYTSA